MHYWLYKCNSAEGGPAGYSGDWLYDVFTQQGPVGWGGHYSTTSHEVAGYLDNDVSVGDVIVAYQTDAEGVVGFCRVDAYIPCDLAHSHGSSVGKELQLQPLAFLDPPFEIHKHKAGTTLANSIAVNGPVMLRELDRKQVTELVAMTGAPKEVLDGKPAPGGWKPLDARIVLSQIPTVDGAFLIVGLDTDRNNVDVRFEPDGADCDLVELEMVQSGLTLGDALRLVAGQVDDVMTR